MTKPDEFVKYPKREFLHHYFNLTKELPNAVFNIIKKINIVIAGGAITSIFSGNAIHDFDLYPLDWDSYKECKLKLDEYVKQSCSISDRVIFDSDNAITFKIEGRLVQLIKKFVVDNEVSTGTPEVVLNSFDFTCCMGCYDCKNEQWTLHQKFLSTVASRELMFNPESNYPICAMYRVLKYIKKGYSIPAGELIKMCLCICNLEMESYSDLKDQLMGIDTLVFKELTEDLIQKHGETSKIDYGIVMEHINASLNELWNKGQFRNSSDNPFN